MLSHITERSKAAVNNRKYSTATVKWMKMNMKKLSSVLEIVKVEWNEKQEAGEPELNQNTSHKRPESSKNYIVI